jgi:hypothetical protein
MSSSGRTNALCRAHSRCLSPLFGALLAGAFVALLPSCELLAPHPGLVAVSDSPRGPEARCAEACHSDARSCSEAQCARGCRIVLDKLVEHEGAQVLACVARATKRDRSTKAKPAACDEMTFADCAAHSGPYANGGPAPPRPPSDDAEDDQ